MKSLQLRVYGVDSSVELWLSAWPQCLRKTRDCSCFLLLMMNHSGFWHHGGLSCILRLSRLVEIMYILSEAAALSTRSSTSVVSCDSCPLLYWHITVSCGILSLNFITALSDGVLTLMELSPKCSAVDYFGLKHKTTPNCYSHIFYDIVCYTFGF